MPVNPSKPRLCPDCSSLLEPYHQKCWDNGVESWHPAFYCHKCKTTHYAEILDAPIIRKRQPERQHVRV